MIDKDILDEVLPVPELETLKEQTIGELKEEGFAITNFHSGGVFYTLLLIVLRVKVEFTELLRDVLNNMFLTHASGVWVDLKAADYGKKRKKAQKTQGLVTLSRTNDQGEAVKIPKGHVFKTEKDVNGEELRFFVLEAADAAKRGPVGGRPGRSGEGGLPVQCAGGTDHPEPHVPQWDRRHLKRRGLDRPGRK